MPKTISADAIRGKTIRLTWTEGPTRGKSYDHTFRDDGTVVFREAGDGGESSAGGTKAPPEAPPYEAVEVAQDIYAVSYLGSTGYTLTVVLNFRDHQMVGFASGAKEWFPLRGTFEVIG